jgi:hypothetical protein
LLVYAGKIFYVMQNSHYADPTARLLFYLSC